MANLCIKLNYFFCCLAVLEEALVEVWIPLLHPDLPRVWTWGRLRQLQRLYLEEHQLPHQLQLRQE